jgi:hypothetical protein
MSSMGPATLGIWIDVLPEAEEEFNLWYRQQHLPERLGVPGFLRGRRWLSTRGTPKYFIWYETESGEVLRSPAYMARLNNPTDWTRRVLPTMRNVVRNAYRLVHTIGREDGHALVTLRLDPADGRADELRTHYQAEVLPEIARLPGVCAVTLYEAEPVATGVVTEERKLVGAMAAAPPFLCACELRAPGAVDRAAWGSLLAPDGPARKGIVRDLTEDAYTLMYSLRWSTP